MRRIQKREFPRPALCPHKACVYNELGICDDPLCNKGNSDSYCFRISNKDLLSDLTKVVKSNE